MSASAGRVLDPSIEPDLAALRTVSEGDVEIVSRTLDDQRWIVAYLVDNGPVRYYLYDRPQRQARFLFTNRQDLESLSTGQDAPCGDQGSRWPRPGVLLYACRWDSDTDGDGIPDRPLPMVLECRMAARGVAISGATTPGTSGWPTAAMPCWP